VGLGLFLWVRPANLPTDVVASLAQSADALPDVAKASYYDHILSVIPNNILYPFLSANVLSILIVASAMGLTIAYLRRKADAEHQVNEPVETVLKVIVGLQELLFAMIRALVKVLPVGIVAFAGQLVAQVEGGIIVGSLETYTLVILAANLLQFFVVLPLFLLVRGLNPWRVLRAMTPAVLMALFTKSSAATLPVTIRSAEERLGVNRSVSRFVLPICCTVNMNGCATFILVTSLYVMQNGGTELSIGSMILWLLISVISAVGNAGVPMGCYFLTLSLMAGIQSPALGIMGIILPIFTVIDMIETAENVWSDSCVCAIVDKQLKRS
jgi:Na+/H+-dicarboxylate symporter